MSAELQCDLSIASYYRCQAPGTDPFIVIINKPEGIIVITYCYGALSAAWPAQSNLIEFLSRMDDGYILRNLLSKSEKQFKCEESGKKILERAKASDKIDEQEFSDLEDAIEESQNAEGPIQFIDMIQDAFTSNDFIFEKMYDTEDFLHEIMQDMVFDHRSGELFFINKIWPQVRILITNLNGKL